MFAEADKRIDGGLYRYNLSAAPTTEATGKELLKGIRTVAGQMKFPTMMYNHIDVPVHENGDTLVVWLTPEVAANISVETLAYVFNMSESEIQYRTIIIPEFPIPNVYAAVTSEDFIYYRDFMTGMEPPFYNPGNRTLKWYYWANGMIGFNPAANCVLFSTDANTSIPTITMAPTGIEFNPDTATVNPGDEIQTHIYLQGTVTASDSSDPSPIAVEPDAAIYTVTAVDSNSAAKALSARTYVDAYGILHIQKKGLASGDVITVTAKAAYINPSGSTSTYTDTFTATVA
jgi:plastocyanin